MSFELQNSRKRTQTLPSYTNGTSLSSQTGQRLISLLSFRWRENCSRRWSDRSVAAAKDHQSDDGNYVARSSPQIIPSPFYTLMTPRDRGFSKCTFTSVVKFCQSKLILKCNRNSANNSAGKMLEDIGPWISSTAQLPTTNPQCPNDHKLPRCSAFSVSRGRIESSGAPPPPFSPIFCPVSPRVRRSCVGFNLGHLSLQSE